ncbi:hypothetical protein key_111 [Erwinia phage KEY]|uniref:Uncharacterized protein n=1 Tax=Erwinia phage KEY TaxID=2821255 RepID=A0AAE7WBQ7_9CAUD|nr:hypothetical protein key_111 [Erwinia phage KEY]
MCNKSVEKLALEFVNGYIAGSCVSYDDALTTFAEALADEGITVPNNDTLEKWLNDAIEESGIFNCDECSWWCWDYEVAFFGNNKCVECDPRDEDDE